MVAVSGLHQQCGTAGPLQSIYNILFLNEKWNYAAPTILVGLRADFGRYSSLRNFAAQERRTVNTCPASRANAGSTEGLPGERLFTPFSSHPPW
jgi:hypothetical protein